MMNGVTNSSKGHDRDFFEGKRQLVKPQHIAIFPLLANGHVYPVLPLCSELVRRKFRITVATNRHYARSISATGAEPVVFQNRSLSPERQDERRRAFALPTNDPEWWTIAASLQRESLEEAAELALRLLPFYQENIPDLILYDRSTITGRILAKRLNCQAIQVSPHFAPFHGSIIRENGVPRNPEAMIRLGTYLDLLLSKHGITDQGNLWHSERLNIYFIPKAFQYHSSSFDEAFCFVGALLERRFPPLWNDNSTGKPLVLISDLSGVHGRSTEMRAHFKMLMDALSGLHCHCILSIGDNADERALGSLPTNFEVNQRASHLEILPRAALAICHAGMGTTLEALYNGVPVLALPLTPFNEEIAYRIEELELGVRLSRNTASIDQIRESVSKMLENTHLTNNVKAMQQVFHGSGGAAYAADRLAQLLQ